MAAVAIALWRARWRTASFLPNLLGEKNNISIFMAQIAITISVSLLASWLVAVS